MQSDYIRGQLRAKDHTAESLEIRALGNSCVSPPLLGT